MGAYLSTPNLEKNSEDGNEHIHYGASSMQGWRISQEVFFFIYLSHVLFFNGGTYLYLL